jgi:hypothetical protein
MNLTIDKETDSEKELIIVKDSPQFSVRVCCDFCQRKSKFVCSQCKAAAYCSQTCQRKSWESHKGVCKDVKKLWGRFFEAERSFVEMGTNEFFTYSSMEQETLFVIKVKQWMHVCSRLALELHQYNSTSAYKQSALLIHKVYRLAPPNQIGLFHTNVHNFMILGMYQEAYDWMINMLPECCKKEFPEFSFVAWKNKTDFSVPIEKDEVLPLFSSRTAEETYGALFFIKFHYYQQCLVKESFQQAFLLGTHNRLGKTSPIYRLGGNELVLREIFSYLVPEGTFTKKEVRKSGEVLQQLQELLRLPEAKPLWKCLSTSSRIVAELFIHQPIVLYRQLSFAILRWKNFSEGIKFLKDIFREEDSSKEK